MCYLFFRKEISWENAADICQKEGGHLPVLKHYPQLDGFLPLDFDDIGSQVIKKQIFSGQLIPEFGDITYLGLQKKVIVRILAND